MPATRSVPRPSNVCWVSSSGAFGPPTPRARYSRPAVATLERLGQKDVLALLRPYAAAAHELAETEVPVAKRCDGLDERAEAVVVIGILGDAILSALSPKRT